jgi:hypothetical protein
LVVVACAVGALGACSSGSDTPQDEAVTADEVLDEAAVAMSGIETVAFMIGQSGAEVFIDDAEQLAFQSADGRFARPASADAVISVEALGFTTDVGAVAIDGTVWLTDPLSGSWTEAPASFSFDPSTLFAPETGFPALLEESAGKATLVDDAGSDNAGGEGHHHLRTEVSAERVSVLTGGLLDEETELDLWVDPSSHLVSEVRFDVPVGDDVSSWTMTLSDYDAEVTIDAPVPAAQG